jgi:ribonuclease D
MTRPGATQGDALVATDDGGLARVAEMMGPHMELALDTESNSMHAYAERICLVQCAFGDAAAPSVAAIDPIAFGADAAAPRRALAPLVAWWSRPGATVIAHGASYDIAILKRDLDDAPRALFDTQVAATMLGLQKTGYASLVEQFLGLRLSKKWQQHDWGRRPIDAAALAYALDDARHVLALARELRAQVKAADLDEEVALGCEAILATAPHAPRPASSSFWKLAGELGRRPPRLQLVGLATLLAWREDVAAALDFPAGRVVNSALLAELARNPPDAAGLRKKLPSRVSDADLAVLTGRLAALRESDAIPARPDTGPPPPPEVKERDRALKRWRDAEAARRGVGAQAILPTPALAWLAEKGRSGLETAPQLGARRLARYADAIAALL